MTYLQFRPKVDRPALLAEAKRVEIRERLDGMQETARRIIAEHHAKIFPHESNLMLDKPTNQP